MKALIPLLICFCSYQSFSQGFADSTSRWLYYYPGYWWGGYTLIAHHSDILIDGKLVNRFFRHANWRGHMPGAELESFRIGYIDFIQSDKVVEFRTDTLGSFDTLYNFSAEPGDSWEMIGGWVDYTVKVKVEDKFVVDWNGSLLTAQTLEYNVFYENNPVMALKDTVYEHMGNIDVYLLPWDLIERSSDGGEGGELYCYRNFTNTNIEYSRIPACEFLLQMFTTPVHDKAGPTVEISLFPNPAHGQIFVDSHSESNIEIKNIFGKTVWRAKIDQGRTQLNISQLSPGLYFFTIPGTSFSRKFVNF